MAVGAEGGGDFKSIWLSLACPELPKILNSSVFHSDNAHTGPCRGLQQQPQPSHSPLAPSCFTRASARPATRDYTSNARDYTSNEGTKGGGTGLQPKNTPGNRKNTLRVVPSTPKFISPSSPPDTNTRPIMATNCCIIGGCHNPGLAGGAHSCRVCGGLLHNLCLQEVSGADDQIPFLCGVQDCMDKMNAEDREGVLIAYTSRKEAEANASTSEESDNGCDDGDRATKFSSDGCSAGTGCLDPTSTTMASLCVHLNPRHFDCEKLPCVGCVDDGVGSESDAPASSTGSNSGRWEWVRR